MTEIGLDTPISTTHRHLGDMTMRENWPETYRPTTFDKCILPDRLKSLLKSLDHTERLPALLMIGPAGIGKTTAARILQRGRVAKRLELGPLSAPAQIKALTRLLSFGALPSLNPRPPVLIIDESEEFKKPVL